MTLGPGDPRDEAVIARWWQHFVATGALPPGLPAVQGRLVRAVHTGVLPSGPVHLKAMAFPRSKDRYRYLLRALPAEHEANLLAAVRAAGVPAPEVVAVRTARRWGMPHRSLLVLRTLAVVADPGPPEQRLRDEATVAARLLAAGIHHRDLHTDNFLRLADGRLAVIDLQSARAPVAATRARRLAIAARLVRDRHGDWGALLPPLVAAGLLPSAELPLLRALAERQRHHYRRSRLHRCLAESTEFTAATRWSGRQFALRSGFGDGRWWWGGREFRRAWLGQRARQLTTGGPLVFCGYFQKWWWLGGGAGLYVPAAFDEGRVIAEVRAAGSALRSFLENS